MRARSAVPADAEPNLTVDAPGKPGIPPTWTSSSKDAVGGSLGPSRLWFTLGYGIVNEVYWPRIDLPQIRDLGFIVADGKGFWSEVKRNGDYSIRAIAPGVPAFVIVHTHSRYVLRLRVSPDPRRDVLSIECDLQGSDPDMRLCVLLAPHLDATGHDNRAIVARHRGRPKAGTACELAELAVWMGQTVDGGTFRTRVGAARMFGLVETSAGRVSVTQLGRDVLGKSGVERAARVTAFLNVELFQALYDQNKGHPLPPLPAIERQIEGLGVSPKQKERARQTFNKSAIYAGFIDVASGRFIKPGLAGVKDERSEQRDDDRNKNRNGGGDDGGPTDLNLDPLLLALLKKIPAVDRGWPAAQRVRWFRTFAMNVSQIYDGEMVEPVELKIDLEEAAK